MRLVVTGGAGFIGSAFVRLVLGGDRSAQVTVLDKLTYAGNLDNLEPVADHSGYRFIKGDICDPDAVAADRAATAGGVGPSMSERNELPATYSITM